MALIGLLGGSFNPAHRGHRRASLGALQALGLDEVWWLVSPGNPLKAGAKDMAPYDARMAAAKAMARHAPIRVSDVEMQLGTRFSIDTMRSLKALYPQHQFIWLLGSDTLPDFHKWRDWRDLARSLPIAVLPRPGYDRSAHAARAMGWLKRFVHPPGQAMRWTEWSAPAIFSFACRKTARPPPPFARTTPIGIARQARLDYSNATRTSHFPVRKQVEPTSRCKCR